MSQTEAGRVVTGPNGLQGQIVGSAAPGPNGEPQVLVQFDPNTRVTIPVGLLVKLAGGNYYLAIEQTELDKHRTTSNEAIASVGTTSVSQAAGEKMVVPVMAEELIVGKRTVASGGVRVHKTVQEFMQTVDQPLTHEELDVERVEINQLVDAPAQLRYEGDTVIIPVMEERLVVEKRLVLKEELRITRRQVVSSQPQQVALRREEVTLEQITPDAQVIEHHQPDTSR